MRIAVIHGANLNLLGLREPEIYGGDDLDRINLKLQELAKRENLELRITQSNHEGELVEAIHAALNWAQAIVINPAAFNIPFPIPAGNRVELFIGTFIGAMTFSGSISASVSCATRSGRASATVMARVCDGLGTIFSNIPWRSISICSRLPAPRIETGATARPGSVTSTSRSSISVSR